MVKYGSWDGSWVVPGITPPGPPLVPTTPGTPPPPHIAGPGMVQLPHGYYGGANSAVGLKSVAQLSLCGHFSGFQGITEGYNLATAGNPNDHKYISGTD